MGAGTRSFLPPSFSFYFWFGVGVGREGFNKIRSGGLGVVAEETESPMRIDLKNQSGPDARGGVESNGGCQLRDGS